MRRAFVCGLPRPARRVIALGGLAATTQYCRTQDAPNVTYVDPKDNSTRTVDASLTCAQQYQLEWWSIWFELILLAIMLGTCFINAFDRARFIYLNFLGLVTILLTQARLWGPRQGGAGSVWPCVLSSTPC